MEKERLKIFSERLTKLRQKKELTQQQLGEVLQIPRVSITRYETAERTPTVDHLVQFAQFFNVPSDYLLGLSSVESYDTDLQAVCQYTGLSEKAIKNLNMNFSTIPELSIMASEFIAVGGLWIFILKLSQFSGYSKQWKDQCINDIVNNGESSYYSDEAKEISKECDFCKMIAVDALTKYIEIFDYRFEEKRLVTPEHTFENLKKKVLAEMEAEQRGKHNPSEE